MLVACTVAPEIAPWVREQLQNLTALLKSDPAKAKSEFRRLNLQLTFNPVEAKPRANYVVKGQCDLSALVLLFLRRKSQSAGLDRMREGSVHSRSSFSAWIAQ
jgi:hypothetical protein